MLVISPVQRYELVVGPAGDIVERPVAQAEQPRPARAGNEPTQRFARPL